MEATLTIPDMYMESLSLLGKEDRLSIAIKLLESVKDVIKPKSKSDDLDLRTCFKGDWAEGKTAVEYANELRSSRTFTRTVDAW